MKRIAVCLLTLLWVSVPQAHGEDAVEYFNLGLKSSMAYKQIEYFTKALELDARLAPAYEKRGMLYYFQGKYDKAIQDYEHYTMLVPNEAEGYRMLGVAYLKNGSYDEATRNLSRAIQIDPELSSAFSFRAEARRLIGQDEESIADSTRAIQLGGDPRIIASAYATRAKIYRKIGWQDLALADARASLMMDPRYVFYRYISAYASPESIRTAGLFGIIGLALVLVFKFRLPPPTKEE
jgi:tetratricopeptide (TPR) repeat protein